MPDWLFDEEGRIAVSLQEVVEHDFFFVFLRDKKGSQFVQDNFPIEDCPLRSQLFNMVIDSNSIYNIAMDMFGNFVVQKMIAESGDDFGQPILEVLSDTFHLPHPIRPSNVGFPNTIPNELTPDGLFPPPDTRNYSNGPPINKHHHRMPAFIFLIQFEQP
uniref:PUM-HD domain-containing protein n=1 Tax=Panagrellus redivivus TaxID=6233 RepID=A0A7E4UWQ8_PANRE